MAKLTILLPAARDRCGRAVMVSRAGDVLLGPFRVLGTASRFVSARLGNPAHDRALPFGDPPCGTYAIASSLAPGTMHARRPGRFGKVGALVLVPTSGDALAAAANGRGQIVMHGGVRDKHRRLRRTRGGLRVGNRNLVALCAAINRAQAAGDPLSTIEVVDVAGGFGVERALPTARRRRDRRGRGPATGVAAQRASMSGAAVAAMALFSVTRASPTRRRFLAAALLAVAGGTLFGACADDRPDPCVPECEAQYGSGSGSGSGSSSSAAPHSRSGSGSGSGSGSDPVEACIEACEADYSAGGGVG